MAKTAAKTATKSAKPAAKKPAKSVAKSVAPDVAKSAPVEAKSAPVETSADSARRFAVPLNRLKPDPKQVRRFDSDAGLTELKAQIVSNGLLQNLTVRPADKPGSYYVTAGNRRLRALKELAKDGATIEPTGVKVTPAFPVPVLALTDSQSATEVSLVENIGREQMTEADQIEAFRRLSEEQNFTAEQIAARFGMSHMTVRRRLKLANVAPSIIAHFRAGNVTLQQMEAFAITDDHDAQERALANLPTYNRHPHTIRSMLTSEKLAADNRFAIYVGEDAYKAAGGTVTRDLFSQDHDDGYFDDKGLAMRLAVEKLARDAAAIREAEGWKWGDSVLSETDIRKGVFSLPRRQRELTDEEIAQIDALETWMSERSEAYDANELSEEDTEAFERKSEEADAIRASAFFYDEAHKPLAGVRLTIGHDGALSILRGLVRDEDADAYHAVANEEDEHDEAEAGSPRATPAAQQEDEGASYSSALIADLTTLRSAALAVEISKRPDVALALIVHKLALAAFYRSTVSPTASCLAINSLEHIKRAPETQDVENEDIYAALDAQQDEIVHLLPADPGALLAWCVDAPHKTLLRVLAVCVGERVNARTMPEQAHHDRPRIEASHAAARLVNLDMAAHWRPSEAFLKRLNKAQIADAVIEAGAAPELAKAIKAAAKPEAIKAALDWFKGRGWTPAPLRTPAAPLEEQDDDETRND